MFKVFLHKIYFFSSTLTAFIIPEAMFSFSVSFLEFRGQKTSTKVNGVGYCNAGWWVRGVQILLYTPRMGYLRSMGCFIFILLRCSAFLFPKMIFVNFYGVFKKIFLEFFLQSGYQCITVCVETLFSHSWIAFSLILVYFFVIIFCFFFLVLKNSSYFNSIMIFTCITLKIFIGLCIWFRSWISLRLIFVYDKSQWTIFSPLV